MNKSILIKILILFILSTMLIMQTTYAADSILDAGEGFIDTGKSQAPPIKESQIKTVSDQIYNILLAIGTVIAVIIGAILGIQFMVGSMDDMKTHLVRTWIYVADIDVNYSGVVKARNDIFAREGLTADTHFIASTGIGGRTDCRTACVAIDFLTYPHIQESDKKYLKALTHLNPTHEYGVAFERGTRLQLPSSLLYYISGTASIDNKG